MKGLLSGAVLVGALFGALETAPEAWAQNKSKKAPEHIWKLGRRMVVVLRVEDEAKSKALLAKLCHPRMLKDADEDCPPQLTDHIQRFTIKKCWATARWKIPKVAEEMKVRWTKASDYRYQGKIYERAWVYFWHGTVLPWITIYRLKVENPETVFKDDPYQGWRLGIISGF